MKIMGYTAVLAIAAFAGNMINIGLSYAVHWQGLPPAEFIATFQVDFPL